MFQPVQIASIIALNGPQDCVGEIVETYRSRRDVLCEGLTRVGWKWTSREQPCSCGLAFRISTG